VQIIINDTATEQALAVAEAVAAYMNVHPGALICLAAGDTPLLAYQELVRLQSAGKVDLRAAYYVGLDEWMGLGVETRGSCAQVMRDGFYAPAGIPDQHMAVWDGHCADANAEMRRIDRWIEAHGGIGLTVLGIGMNGHVGFNEPGAGLPEHSIKAELDETTKRVSAKYFDRPLPVEYGLGVGAGTLKKAKKVILMANGARKADIIYKTVKEPPTPEVPSSLMMDHPDISLYLDRDAARQETQT